jgi:hypothetical protein
VVGILLVSFVVSAASASPAAEQPAARYGDFAAYYVAGRAFLEGDNPFDPAIVERLEKREGLHQAFVIWNPPWIFPLLAPWAMLPFDVGAIAWCLTNVALAVLTGLLVGRRIGLTPFASTIATLTFVPVGICLGMSQWAIVVLFGVTLFDENRRAGRPYLAGAALALAAVKPHLIALVWLSLVLIGPVSTRLKMIAGLAATLGGLALVTWAWQPDILSHYVWALEHPASSLPTNYFSATPAMWLRWLAEQALSADSLVVVQFIPLAGASVVLVAMTLAGWVRNNDELVNHLVLASMMVLPYGWHYDQATLLGNYLTLWSRAPSTAGLILMQWLYAGMIANRAAECYFAWGIVAVALFTIVSGNRRIKIALTQPHPSLPTFSQI